MFKLDFCFISRSFFIKLEKANPKTYVMKRVLLLFTVFFLFSGSKAQNVTISGFVEDANTGERLIGVAVYETNWHKYGTFTNEYGFYSLTLPKGKIKLRVSYIGYQPVDTVLDLQNDLQITFRLASATMLKEVVVTGYKNDVQSSQTGKIDIPVNQIENLPVIFGEADLLKTMQLMPGVSGGVEGSSGIYVRGGSPDQNLILLDGVPMYNVMHLGGFFSVFTPEAIKDVTLYKSGFPARFGGRLSSVIDVRMKDGNRQKLTGSVSVGLISSKFTLEGPIQKGKGSFIVSGRRTYFDLLAAPFMQLFGTHTYTDTDYKAKESFSGGYYFYDIYAKVNHRITKRDRIYFSLYSGQDIAYLKTKYQGEYYTDGNLDMTDTEKGTGNLGWGNNIFALRWNHAFNKKLFANLNLTYSKFFFSTSAYYSYDSKSYTDSLDSYHELYSVSYNLGINDISANLDFTYAPNTKHYIRFGGQAIHHTFRPGYITTLVEIDSFKFDTVYANNILYAPEFGLYIEDDWAVTNWLKLNIGLRASSFLVRHKNFYSLEPRISGRILLNKNLSLKASYARMTQYLHLVSNNTVGLPLDLWLPATDRVLPEKSWQAAAAISWLTPNNLSISIEGYYKEMQNVVEIKEGNSIFSMSLNDIEQTWEDKVSQGKGWSYGAEFFLRKDYGKLTGWLGYTLAWSWRQFDDINNGEPFPYKYDRRHEINIAASYKLKKNLTLGAVFVYGSGTPITLAQLQYPYFESLWARYCVMQYDNDSLIDQHCYYGNVIDYYGGRNGFRLPSYQRLDLSLNWKKQKKHGIRTWTFGAYNVYSHVNPFFTTLSSTYNPQTGTSQLVLDIYSLFPFMPFISYKFQWK